VNPLSGLKKTVLACIKSNILCMLLDFLRFQKGSWILAWFNLNVNETHDVFQNVKLAEIHKLLINYLHSLLIICRS